MDKAHKATDELLEAMEREIAAIYREAQKGISDKAAAYFEQFQRLDEKKRKLVADGKLSEDEYLKWRKNKILYSNRFVTLQGQITAELARVNETAAAYINDQLPDVYALNYNYVGKGVQRAVKGYSFTLIDANTVKRLATKTDSLLPKRKVDVPKDKLWNAKKMRTQVLQGILQGESMDKIADRMQTVTDMNGVSAIRNARTMVTGAENAGRIDMMHKAATDGVIMRKRWIATTDSRTRDWHRDLDGIEVDMDEPFQNDFGDIMFPGDPTADGANVYNCRCTLGYRVVGFGNAQVQEAMAQQAQPTATTEDAIITAHDLGVKYAQFEKMPLEQVNNAIDAVRTLPKDCVPKVIASGKDVSTVTGRPLGRKADQWWGVTYDYRAFSLRTMQLGYDATDFDGGLIVGLNTQKFRTLDALTKAKKATNDAYFAKTGRYWSFNTDGKATAYHEIGHCFADVRGLPKGWEDVSARWAEESACDLLKKPDEAFAEAWAAYHLGDKRLPDYISAIIGGLK